MVVGGGQAGLQVCESVRSLGFDGKLLLIGSEKSLPYQRPPLSKAFLYGDTDLPRLVIRPDKFFEKHNIDLLLNTTVSRIDRERHSIALISGENISYDRIALTTGARVRRIKEPDLNSNICYVRDITDSQNLGNLLATANSVGIIGGGFIGLEVAAVCNGMGKSVTLIEQASALMARGVPRDVALYYQEVHSAKGVDIHLNSAVENIDNYSEKLEITFNGIKKMVDILVVGIGVQPNIELAEQSGLHCENGIVVNSTGCTLDSKIYAAGDCASFYSNYYGKHVRLESVQNAIDTAKIVAANMLGQQKEYDAVPWFWSDQYDLKLQIAGIVESDDQPILLGSMEAASFSIFYFHRSKHVGTISINKPRDHMLSRKLLSKDSDLRPEQLHTPSFNLSDFAKKLQ